MALRLISFSHLLSNRVFMDPVRGRNPLIRLITSNMLQLMMTVMIEIQIMI